MIRFPSFLVMLAVLTACSSDFSTSISRGDNGQLLTDTMWLASGTRQYVYPPGEELFLGASSSSEPTVEVRDVTDERLIVEAIAPGSASLRFRTDTTAELELLDVEVRQPDEIDFHAGERWVTTTDEFAVSYDIYFDGQALDGAGYKAVSSAPGLSVREKPLELGGEGTDSGSRTLHVLEGRAGEFVLQVRDGSKIELTRVHPTDIDRIESEFDGSVEVGATATLEVWGVHDDQEVMNLDGFRLKQKSRAVCRKRDGWSSSGHFVAGIEFRTSGRCEMLLIHDEAGFERTLTWDVP